MGQKKKPALATGENMICQKCSGEGKYTDPGSRLVEYCWICDGTGRQKPRPPTPEERIATLEQKVKTLERMVAKLRTPKKEA